MRPPGPPGQTARGSGPEADQDEEIAPGPVVPLEIFDARKEAQRRW